MEPMPAGVSLALYVVGTGLNLFGVWCGFRAFLTSWNEYGSGDLWPWFTAAVARTRAFGRRLIFWRKPESVSVTVQGSSLSISGGEAYVTVTPGFPDPGSDERRFAMLQHAIELAFKQASEDRGRANQRHSELESRLSEIVSRLDSESARLEQLSRDVASSDVRIQIVGLMAIGLGTVFMAVPAFWDSLAAIL